MCRWDSVETKGPREALIFFICYYFSGLSTASSDKNNKEISRFLANECGEPDPDSGFWGMFAHSSCLMQGMSDQETVLVLKKIIGSGGNDADGFAGISIMEELVVNYTESEFCNSFRGHLEPLLEMGISSTVDTLLTYARVKLPSDFKNNTSERAISWALLKQSGFKPADNYEIDVLDVIEKFCKATQGPEEVDGSMCVNDLLEIGHINRRNSTKEKLFASIFPLMKSVEISYICTKPEFSIPYPGNCCPDKTLKHISSIIGLSRNISILREDFEGFLKRDEVLALQKNAGTNMFFSATPAEFKGSYSAVTGILHNQLALPVVLVPGPPLEFSEVSEGVFMTRRRIEQALKMYVMSLLRCKLHDAGLELARPMVQRLAAIQYRRYRDFVQIYEIVKEIQSGLQDTHLLCTKHEHKGHMVIKLAQAVVLTSVLDSIEKLCALISGMQEPSVDDAANLEELYQELLGHEEVIASQALAREFNNLILFEVSCLTHFDDVRAVASFWAESVRVWQTSCKDTIMYALNSSLEKVPISYLEDFLEAEKGFALCRRLGLGYTGVSCCRTSKLELVALIPLFRALQLDDNGSPSVSSPECLSPTSALRKLWVARQNVYQNVINDPCTDPELTKDLFKMYVGEVPEEFIVREPEPRDELLRDSEEGEEDLSGSDDESPGAADSGAFSGSPSGSNGSSESGGSPKCMGDAPSKRSASNEPPVEGDSYFQMAVGVLLGAAGICVLGYALYKYFDKDK